MEANKKNFYIAIFFIILGIIILISTLIEFGISKQGRFGIISGAIAIIYAFMRTKFLIKK